MKRLCVCLIGLLVIIGFISGCCSWNYSKEDFEFTQKELALFGAYNIGDTIYFESNLGDIDTITVVEISEEKYEGNSCFISTPPYHNIGITIKHLPNDRWAGTSQSEGEEKKITYQSLISISKHPLAMRTDYSIHFKGFYTMGDSTLGSFQKECIVNGKIISDCYKVTHGYPERVTNPDDIEIVYCTAKYGLTAYTNKAGETWFLKDLE